MRVPNPMLPQKPRIFVSYHHDNDQDYYDAFYEKFSEAHDIITDHSLREQIDSDDPEYVRRRIREEYLTGSSCTIVLLGAETYKRKFVDWEIKATLDKQHGLIGIELPGISRHSNGNPIIPGRFEDNYISGYASLENWQLVEIYYTMFPNDILKAKMRSKSLIRNNKPMMTHNL